MLKADADGLHVTNIAANTCQQQQHQSPVTIIVCAGEKQQRNFYISKCHEK